MKIKEIVYCYVSDIVDAPSDMKGLRESFVANGFIEKVISPSKFIYKRGASLAFEFNYDAEVIEMQVILEKTGEDLRVSVGNWGFPFEPLMMKKRFQRNLSLIVEAIRSNGVLPKNREAKEIVKEAESKNKAAISLILYSFLGALVYVLIRST